MYKISNWLFGSFFRTLGRILVYIFIGYILFNIIDIDSIKLPKLDISSILFMNVNADTKTDAWILNMEQVSSGEYYNWTGADTLGNTIATEFDSKVIDLYDEHGSVIYEGMILNYIYNPSSINVGTNGVSIGSNSNKYFYTGYLYRTTTYVCSTQPLSRYDSTSTTIGATPTVANNYSFIQLLSLKVPSDIKSNIDTNINYCYAINAIINSRASNYPVWSRVTGTTNTRIYLLGYSNEVLGYGNNLSSSDIQSIVQNSGLATATDIQGVNNSINQVQNSLSSSTTSIINNQNSNKNQIISNANTNSQNEIENANENTDRTIENANENTDKTIESQKVCQQIDKKDIETNNKYLKHDGSTANSDYYGITSYINIFKSDVKILNIFPYSGYASLCYYDVNKNLISCENLYNLSSLNIPNNAYYFRSSIYKSINKPTFEVCKDGNQAMSDGINDLHNSITDTSAPNTGELSNSAGWLPAGPVDSILNLPLSFLTNLNSNLSRSCQSVNLPLPYINKNLELPCVNSLYAQIEGLPVWINSIGIIASAFILFSYLISLYKYIDDVLTFRENNYIDNWSGV